MVVFLRPLGLRHYSEKPQSAFKFVRWLCCLWRNSGRNFRGVSLLPFPEAEVSGIFRSGHAVCGSGSGVWKNRLFSGGMLLWSGDGRRVRHYVSQFQLCPQRSSSLSYAAGIQRLRLSSLRNSALGFRKEKGRRTGSGLLFDFL